MKGGNKIVKAGKLLCVDEGNYSDYQVIGFFVTLKDMNPLEELNAYLTDRPEQRKNYHFEGDEFLAFLIEKGFLLEVDYASLYLGSYSDPNTVRLHVGEVE